MNRLYNAIRTNDITTENGMPTHSTSGSYVLDMFFKLGAARGMSESDILFYFDSALQEDTLLTIKGMFYNRDVRGGQGERRSFRIMFKHLCQNYPAVANVVVWLIPEYGRWDDLFVALDTDVEAEMLNVIKAGLYDKNTLCKKWMPREGKKFNDVALQLMNLLDVSPQEYRGLISLTDEDGVIETLMCEKRWDEINYSHVPSIASKKYRKAFGRNDTERYGEYLSALERGDKSVKIHADAIFPNDVIKPYLDAAKGSGYRVSLNFELDRTLEAQWKALPDYVQDGMNFIAVVDTSGSMHTDNAWEVAYSLGIYLGERNKSVFKNAFITFSSRPQLITLTGKTLHEKVKNMLKHEIVDNTNLEKVFELILSKAVKANLSAEDMPNNIVIISDMQFDASVAQPSDNAMEMIRRQYNDAGYDVPQVIFWNVRSSNGVPAKFDERGTCLISGYSPSIMKNLLGGKLSPMEMMLSTLNSERYNLVEEALG